jgi:anti-sigma regulatory factor (Ser/Thr protein kinase)
VRHGGLAEHEWIRVRAQVGDRSVRIEVSDPGPGFVVPEEAVDDGTRRGLHLLQHMPDRWGVLTHGITRVWFEVDAHAAHPEVRGVSAGRAPAHQP